MTAGLADSHLHIFRNGMPSGSGRPVLGNDSEIEAYEAFRRVHGIVAGLVVGYEGDGIDPGNNSYIRSLAASHPWMATLANVSGQAPLEPTAAERLLREGHAGLAVYLPDAAAGTTLADWPAETWRILAAHRAILSLNARPAAAAAAAPAIRRQGECRFVFSHLGLPGRLATVPGPAEAANRIAALLAMAGLDQVMVKISGLYAVSDPPHGYPHPAAAPFIELLLDRFGPSRCLWGSDFSPALEFVSFPQTLTIPYLGGLSPGEHDRVMAEIC